MFYVMVYYLQTMSQTISSQIKDAALREVAEVMRGDCASVAAGLREYFGGEYVCLYATPENAAEELPAHIVVDINGELYDGSGQVTREKLFEMHLVLNGDGGEPSPIADYFEYEAPPSYMIDSNIKNTVVSRLS